MRYIPIAKITVPAIAGATAWIRTAKTVYLSSSTPKWMLDMITDLQKES